MARYQLYGSPPPAQPIWLSCLGGITQKKAAARKEGADANADPGIQEVSGSLAAVKNKDTVVDPTADLSGPPAANRHRLQDERSAITHHFTIGDHEGYLTVGLYPNGQPGEIFIRMAKAGSTISGLMECFGAVVSVSLQHGVPLKVLCDKLSHTRFEPSGWTGNPELGYAKSHNGLPVQVDRTALPVRQTVASLRRG